MTMLLLDRDGTLIEDVGYIADANQVELLDGVVETLQELQSRGFQFVIVSNQSGVGRGIVPEESVAEVDERLRELLADAHVQIAASYYCLHAPDALCSCRKPSPGMLRQAAADLDFQLSNAWMVGDRDSDIEAGLRAGCQRVFALGFSPLASDAEQITSLRELVTSDV